MPDDTAQARHDYWASPPWTVSAIVDEVNDWQLFDASHCCGRRVKLRAFLAKRQGLPGSYCNLFAPVEGELADGYRLYTGERITGNAGKRHILGEEALRALLLLEPEAHQAKHVDAAIGRASDAMSRRLHQHETTHHGGLQGRGVYCCNRCSAALWRVFAVGGLDDADDRLDRGMRWLKAKRDADGAWAGMPFHYTLSALVDAAERAGSDAARAELRHARPAMERRLKRSPRAPRDVYAKRRRAILEHGLMVAASPG